MWTNAQRRTTVVNMRHATTTLDRMTAHAILGTVETASTAMVNLLDINVQTAVYTLVNGVITHQ